MHTRALFISDLHLQEAMPETAAAFMDFLRRDARETEALYILGDLFEFWPGDDASGDRFIQPVIRGIRAVADAGVKVFWTPGNRDFLTGKRFLEETGASLLPDLYTAEIAGRKIMLSHGDAQCTDDKAYLEFRAKVRDPARQRRFLLIPLFIRKLIFSSMRKKSKAKNRDKAAYVMDVNTAEIDSLFEKTGADAMIHGHTHRPADHVHATPCGDAVRMVLSDWNFDNPPYRGDFIAVTDAGDLVRYQIRHGRRN